MTNINGYSSSYIDMVCTRIQKLYREKMYHPDHPFVVNKLANLKLRLQN